MIGISSMGVSLSGVILPLIMVQFVDEYGWRAGWQLLAVLSWVLVLPAAMLMRSTPEQYGPNPDGKTDAEMASPRGNTVRSDFANSLTRAQALRTSTLYMFVIAFGFSGVGLGTMLLHTIPFMTDAGFSRSTASLSLTLLAMPAAFTKPIWGWLMDYLRRRCWPPRASCWRPWRCC
jgi:nitrate/nitrite transporter NarK